MNPITVFQLASWTIGLWDYWLVGIEAGAGPKVELRMCSLLPVKFPGSVTRTR